MDEPCRLSSEANGDDFFFTAESVGEMLGGAVALLSPSFGVAARTAELALVKARALDSAFFVGSIGSETLCISLGAATCTRLP